MMLKKFSADTAIGVLLLISLAAFLLLRPPGIVSPRPDAVEKPFNPPSAGAPILAAPATNLGSTEEKIFNIIDSAVE